MIVILVVVPLRLADGRDQPDGDPAVADRRDPGAGCMGATINTMVLAGLVIAMGEVVDDAIIDVENIVRRLRLNRAAGRPPLGVPGRAGRLARSPKRRRLRQPDRDPGLRPGLLPRRARRLVLPAAGAGLRAGDPGLAPGRPDGHAGPVADAPDRARPSAGANRRWSRILKADLPRDPAGAGAAARAGRSCILAVAFAATGWAVPGLGEEFLPNFQENDFLMHWVEKPGTSLEAMRRITVNASKELRAVPGVRNFGSHIGRAEVADEVVGPNFTELWISVDPKADHSQTVDQDPEGRRRLPRSVRRRADLPEGADQGSPHGRRAPRWWCASSAPTWPCSARRRRRSPRR